MNKFNRLYYRDAYVWDFMAEVTSCFADKKGYGIILSDTAFYPEGGGQPGDRGTLANLEVIDVKEKEDEVVHYLAEPLAAGTKITGHVDKNFRFDNMQNHTGEHIVSGIVHRDYGYENVGFRMKDYIEIDFSGSLTWQQLMDVEKKANEVIFANMPVAASFPDEEELGRIAFRAKKELKGQVRLISVGDADCCACCGTHVKTTGEIGLIKILSAVAHKGGVRIEMVCGGKALRDYGRKHDQNSEIMHMLSLRPYEVSCGVKKLLDHLNALNHEKSRLAGKYLDLCKAEISNDSDPLIVFEEGIEREMLVRFANDLVNEKGIKTAAVLNEEEGGYGYVIASSALDLRKLARPLNEKLAGQGGGSSRMIRGVFKADKEDIEKVLKDLLCPALENGLV